MKAFRTILPALLLLTVLFSGTAVAIDTDRDGLSDDVELQLGSSSLHRDVFVEVDWLVVNGKSMKPRGNFVQIAQSIFEAAPVSNLDGTTGIRLHVQMGQGIRVTGLNAGISFVDAVLGPNWAEFDQVKQQYFTPSRLNTHHYCLFIDAIVLPNGATSSGISRNNLSSFRTGASDFVVALGPSSGFFNYPRASEYKFTQVGTFIHELGHNLGLMHGGRDHVSFKPNHLSVMSYAFQVLGIPITTDDGTLYYIYDYGRVAPAPINENSINEARGIGTGNQIRVPGVVYGTRWYGESGLNDYFEIFDSSFGVDFNANGVLNSGYRLNLNVDDRLGNLTPGLNEWNRLIFTGGLVGSPSNVQPALPRRTTLICLKSSDLPKQLIRSQFKVQRGTFRDLDIK